MRNDLTLIFERKILIDCFMLRKTQMKNTEKKKQKSNF